ncbi:MAG: GTPase HflX, partial [Calditerrivibrio sp.]|nr:GTPase HflX [Calditerrivibrio sp.]MCA1981012.1 GTPase HflX [Calditerrivibrio sp.]
IDKHKILVFNKIDAISEDDLMQIKNEFKNAVFISAMDRKTFGELINKISHSLFMEGKEIGIISSHH